MICGAAGSLKSSAAIIVDARPDSSRQSAAFRLNSSWPTHLPRDVPCPCLHLWAHLRGFEPTTKRIQAQFQLGYDSLSRAAWISRSDFLPQRLFDSRNQNQRIGPVLTVLIAIRKPDNAPRVNNKFAGELPGAVHGGAFGAVSGGL
jgi:hypothetical protein